MKLLSLNKRIKQTNWWRNKFAYTAQFEVDSEIKYRVVNVGSNSARFCFFYEDICGQNWSTGAQGLDMDFEILKKYSYSIEKDGIVLIPICPFSLVSEYLDGNKSYRNRDSYLKFTNILDSSQLEELPFAKDMWGFLNSPLKYNHKAWRYIIKDVQLDRRLEIEEQHMMYIDLVQDANLFMEYWKNEFDIDDFSAPLPKHLSTGMDKSIELLAKMIEFCIGKEFRPIIVVPPMTSVLYNKFPKSFWQTYIYDGIKKLNKPNVQVLDYVHDVKWQASDLYFNSLFMNHNGRKAFTKKVLNDVGIKQ